MTTPGMIEAIDHSHVDGTETLRIKVAREQLPRHPFSRDVSLVWGPAHTRLNGTFTAKDLRRLADELDE